MFTSQQIAGQFQAFPQASGGMFGPQQMPTVYGHQRPAFNYGDQDPFGYGMASRGAGMAVGMGGISMMGGIMGGGLLMKGMAPAFLGGAANNMWSRGLQGLTTTGAGVSRMAAFQAASGFGAKAGVLAGGVGRAALMGGAAIAPYYAGYKALQFAGRNMYQGARFQQDANRIMGRHLQFQTGSTSRTGFGASESQMRDVTRMISSMSNKDTLRSRDELMRVMDKLGRRNMFQDVSNVNQFKKKFKQMVGTLKHMARTFGTSIEEAIPLMDQMKRSGIYNQTAQKGMAMQMRLSGLNPQQAMAVAGQAAQMGRAAGGHGGAAAQGAVRFMSDLKFAQQMGGGVGTRVSNLMSEMSGGLRGGQARAAVTKQMTGLTLRFLRGPLGRMALAGLANKDFTGMDRGKVEQLMRGELSTNQLMKMGLNQTASMRNKGRFINREGDLRTSFLKQAGPLAMAGLVRGAMKSHIIKGTSDTDIQELIMKRFAGGNRRTAQFLMTMMKNLPKMRADQNRAAIRQMGLMDRANRVREVYSMDAVRKRMGHAIWSRTAEPFQRIGQNMYTDLSRWGRNALDYATGQTSVNVSNQAAAAFQKMAGGGGSADFLRRIGGGRGLIGGRTDLQRKGPSGLIGSAMGAYRSIAERLAGTSSTDLGTQLATSFTRDQLRSFGASTAAMKDRGNRAVLFRVNKAGQLQARGQDSANTQAVMMSNSQLGRLRKLEQRRSSGARAAEIVRKHVGKNSEMRAGASAATNIMKSKIMANPLLMEKLRSADPGERRKLLRAEFKKQARGNGAIGRLMKKVAASDYGGTGAGAMDNAMDDIISVAETNLQKLGLDKITNNAGGGTEQNFNSAREAKEAQTDVFKTMGKALGVGGIGGMMRFAMSGFQRTDTTRFLESSDIFKSMNKVSTAVMKQITGQKLSKAEELTLARINTHRGGDLSIGGQKIGEDDAKRLQQMLTEAARNRKAGVGSGLDTKLFQRWQKSITAQNRIGIANQLKTFGRLGAQDVRGFTGKVGGEMQKFFGDLQGISSRQDIINLTEGGGRFGRIAKMVAGMKGGDRRKFLTRLGASGEAGKAAAAAFRQYMSTKGDEKAKAAAAGKVLFGRAVGAGQTTAGKSGTLGGTLEIWNTYVKANQQFVNTVASILGDGKLKKAAANMKPARKK